MLDDGFVLGPLRLGCSPAAGSARLLSLLVLAAGHVTRLRAGSGCGKRCRWSMLPRRPGQCWAHSTLI